MNTTYKGSGVYLKAQTERTAGITCTRPIRIVLSILSKIRVSSGITIPYERSFLKESIFSSLVAISTTEITIANKLCTIKTFIGLSYSKFVQSCLLARLSPRLLNPYSSAEKTTANVEAFSALFDPFRVILLPPSLVQLVYASLSCSVPLLDFYL